MPKKIISAYLHWLNEALKEANCHLHAFVLMTNHVHLVLAPAHALDVPRLIISLGRRYVQYVNRSYRRTGTLWDSRYKPSLIQAETYLLLCQRYIELNPVRAAMVRDRGDYRWSSYRANALGQPQPILTPHPLYLALRSDARRRETAYRTLFRAPLDQSALDDIRLALTQDRPLGDSRFYAVMPERSESDESRERAGDPASRKVRKERPKIRMSCPCEGCSSAL